MKQDFLLDTNTFFNILIAYRDGSIDGIVTQLGSLTEGNLYISTITKVEIIAVLGKYARGSSGVSKCNCIISENGDVCPNHRYTEIRPRWKNKVIKRWLKLIRDSLDGASEVMNLTTLSFDSSTIEKSEKIIQLALRYKFASMDALIAATAQCEIENGHNIVVVTSDKSLQSCLNASNIPWKDVFA